MILRFLIIMIFEFALMLFFIRGAYLNFHPERYYTDIKMEHTKALRRLLGKNPEMQPPRPNRFAGYMAILAASAMGLAMLGNIFFLIRYLVTGHF